MTYFFSKNPQDFCSHAELAYIGKYLKRVNFSASVDPKFSKRSGASSENIIKSYPALLCEGKINNASGVDGYCLELAWHSGVTHSESTSEYNLERWNIGVEIWVYCFWVHVNALGHPGYRPQPCNSAPALANRRSRRRWSQCLEIRSH